MQQVPISVERRRCERRQDRAMRHFVEEIALLQGGEERCAARWEELGRRTHLVCCRILSRVQDALADGMPARGPHPA